MIDKLEHSDLACEIPLVDTWGAKKSAGYWDLALELDFNQKSIQEHNHWYAKTLKKTLEAFSSFTRAHGIYFNPIYSARDIHEGMTLIWQQDCSYEKYLENVFETIKKYPVNIDSINIDFDFFVYVRTEKSFPNPVRTWIREFGESNDLSSMMIELSFEDEEAGIVLTMAHTLFYPFSYNADDNDDNTELFNLNRPLLEEALRNWENEFNSEIEAEGLPGIYKYGYLPQDQW